MDIRRFRIFQKVAETKSFTKAAQQLYMSQPAVSKAINELEEELQTPLFERFPKKTILTPEGTVFLTKVTSLLAHYDAVLDHVIDIHTQYTLRIGSSITIANESLSLLIQKLSTTYPTLHIQVEVASSSAILDMLLMQKLDIAFVEGIIPDPAFICIPFSTYQIKAVASPSFVQNHPVTSLADIAKLPLLLREEGSAIRDVVESCFLLRDLPVHPTWTSTNSSALLKAAVHGFGVAFLPEKMVMKKLKEHTLMEIQLHDIVLENSNHIVYLKHKHLNEGMENLIAFATQRK